MTPSLLSILTNSVFASSRLSHFLFQTPSLPVTRVFPSIVQRMLFLFSSTKGWQMFNNFRPSITRCSPSIYKTTQAFFHSCPTIVPVSPCVEVLLNSSHTHETLTSAWNVFLLAPLSASHILEFHTQALHRSVPVLASVLFHKKTLFSFGPNSNPVCHSSTGE